MTLSSEERARFGLPPVDPEMPSDYELELSSPRPEREPKPKGFAVAQAGTLSTIAMQIDALERDNKIDAYEASIHRLFLGVLRDPDARAGDRMKAVEGLAKLRGLFLQKFKDEGALVGNQPTQKLLEELAKRFGLPIHVFSATPRAPLNILQGGIREG